VSVFRISRTAATILVTFRNGGPEAAVDAGLDVGLSNATIVGSFTTLGSCSGGACSFGTLSSGQAVLVAFAVELRNDGAVPVSASVFSSSADPVPGNNSSSTTLPPL
jgi:hypothetical protein